MKTLQKTISKIVFGTLVYFAGVAFAYASVPTVQVMNATQNPGCNFASCGSQYVSADPGDVISVQIFYNNETSSSQNVTLNLSPKSQTGTTYNFAGGASNVSASSAVVYLTGGTSQTISLMSGTARWYKDMPQNGGTSVQTGINADSLFSGGFSVGTLASAQGGVSPNQGVLVVDFQIGNTQPTKYACNDGIDNDGDGYTDYPSDRGCTSTTDNDEYNAVSNIIYGCTDSRANNYNANANHDNGSCTYNQTTVYGCMNTSATNYNYRANRDDGSCTYYNNNNYNNYNNYNNTYYGCMNTSATNYNYRATRDDGSCFYNNNNSTNQMPSVATTVASNISMSAAQINGLTYANNSYTNGWFEWGQTTAMTNRTTSQSLGISQGANMSAPVSGLLPGVIYYYRAVAQNSYGTVYGDRMQFKTLSDGTSYVPTTTTTKIVYVHDSSVKTNLTPAQTVPSLLALRIENKFDSVCVGDSLEYTVTYQNVSGRTISNVVLQVVLPSGVVLEKASVGSFDADTNTLTVPLGTLTQNQTGTVSVNAKLSSIKSDSDIVVTTSHMVYTHPVSGAQEDVIAYDINHKGACRENSLLGASAFFGNGFFPTTLFGWLVLILIILILILVARNLYKKTSKS